jgi:adenosylcobinamide-GDP ribazoletransferase
MRRALSFLTVLGRAAEPNPRTLAWFPVVGLAVGAIVGGAWWMAARVWPAALAAVVAVAVDATVTGCLHLDGLADAADGLLPAVDRDKRLAIMADPRIGAFGAVVLLVVLALRTTAFAVTPVRVWIVVAVWCGSRTMMAVVARSVPYARAENGGSGTASAFRNDAADGERGAATWLPIAAYGLCATVVLAEVGAGSRGLEVVAGEIAAMVLVVWFAVRRLGGYTGDVLGAGGVIAETVGLLVLAAR